MIEWIKRIKMLQKIWAYIENENNGSYKGFVIRLTVLQVAVYFIVLIPSIILGIILMSTGLAPLALAMEFILFAMLVFSPVVAILHSAPLLLVGNRPYRKCIGKLCLLQSALVLLVFLVLPLMIYIPISAAAWIWAIYEPQKESLS